LLGDANSSLGDGKRLLGDVQAGVKAAAATHRACKEELGEALAALAREHHPELLCSPAGELSQRLGHTGLVVKRSLGDYEQVKRPYPSLCFVLPLLLCLTTVSHHCVSFTVSPRAGQDAARQPAARDAVPLQPQAVRAQGGDAARRGHAQGTKWTYYGPLSSMGVVCNERTGLMSRNRGNSHSKSHDLNFVVFSFVVLLFQTTPIFTEDFTKLVRT
jgi:hypothetical protein